MKDLSWAQWYHEHAKECKHRKKREVERDFYCTFRKMGALMECDLEWCRNNKFPCSRLDGLEEFIDNKGNFTKRGKKIAKLVSEGFVLFLKASGSWSAIAEKLVEIDKKGPA